MRNFAVLLAMIAGFTVVMGPAIGLSVFASPEAEPQAAPVVSPICDRAFADAGGLGKADPATDVLDLAVRSCASVKEWVLAAEVHPAAIAGTDPRRFLEERCRDQAAGLTRYATCRGLGHLPDEPARGTVMVLAPASSQRTTLEPGVGVAIILDTSGSMLDTVAGERRIDIAKASLAIIVEDALPSGMLVGVRTFGGASGEDSGGNEHRRDRAPGGRAGREAAGEDSGGAGTEACDTRLAMPMAPLDRGPALELVDQLAARKRTSTPIAASLAAVAGDLAAVTGRRTVVLVTDGDETCGGDPLAEVERLRSAGSDVAVHIVGVSLEDGELRDRMAIWAEAGGGGYFDASSTDQLVAAIETAITGRAVLGSRVRVIASDGEVVGRGTVGGSPIDLRRGTYEIRVMTEPPVVFRDVRVDGGSSVELELTETV